MSNPIVGPPNHIVLDQPAAITGPLTATVLGGTLSIGNTISVGNTLSIGNFSSTMTVFGTLSIGNTISIGNLSSTFTVFGTLSIGSTVSIGNTISVGNFASTLTVFGTLSVANTLSIGNTLSVGNTLNVFAGNTFTIANTMTVFGTLAIGNTVNVAWPAGATVTSFGTLSIGNWSQGLTQWIANTLTVFGTLSVGNTVIVSVPSGSTFFLGNTASVFGTLAIGNTVNVAWQAGATVTSFGTLAIGNTVNVAWQAGATVTAFGTLSIGNWSQGLTQWVANTLTVFGTLSIGNTISVGNTVSVGNFSSTLTVFGSLNIGNISAFAGTTFWLGNSAIGITGIVQVSNSPTVFIAAGQTVMVGNSGILTVPAHGRYYWPSYNKKMFYAAMNTGNALGLGLTLIGLQLWNGSTLNNVVLHKTSGMIAVASANVKYIQFATGTGQSIAPTGQVAVTKSGNCFIGQAAPTATVTGQGTFSAIPTMAWPLMHNTAALATTGEDQGWQIDFEGSIIIPPYCFCCIAPDVASGAAAMICSLMWEEVPV